jgi:hypothetical protein
MKLLLTIACSFVLFSASATENPKNLHTPHSTFHNYKGWKKLFDGKTKAGWHIYHNDGNGSDWQIQDGALVLVHNTDKTSKVKTGGDLVTDGTYENYHLSLEWKISQGGNSGIIFGVQEDAAYEHTFNSGCEMQVLDNDGHSDGKITKHRAGDLYDLIKCNRETVKPVGEWNHAEIIIDHGHLTLMLNEEKVVETDMWTPEWNALVAGSKFKKMTGFATFKSGHIALQDHGNQVSYRNIKIKEL